MTGRWSGSLLTCMTTSTGAWRPLVRVSDIQAPREMPARTYGWTFSTRTCPNATRLPKPMLSIATEHSVIRSMWSYTTASIRLSSSDMKSRPSSLLKVCTQYSRPSRRSIRSTSSMHARRWPACVGFTGPACRFPMQGGLILPSRSFPYVVVC